MVATLEKDKGARSSNSKQLAMAERSLINSYVLPPFPCGMKKSQAFLERRLRDQVIRLVETNYFSSLEDRNSARYCL